MIKGSSIIDGYIIDYANRNGISLENLKVHKKKFRGDYNYDNYHTNNNTYKETLQILSEVLLERQRDVPYYLTRDTTDDFYINDLANVKISLIKFVLKYNFLHHKDFIERMINYNSEIIDEVLNLWMNPSLPKYETWEQDNIGKSYDFITTQKILFG